MNKSVAVKERPVRLSAHDVRAVLEGRKAQMRSIIKPQPTLGDNGYVMWKRWGLDPHRFASDSEILRHCPLGRVGSRLWVKEDWSPIPEMKPSGYFSDPKWIDRTAWYATDNDKPMWGGKWISSLRMPRWASRITLEIDRVRVQRLGWVSEADAEAEGVFLRELDGSITNLSGVNYFPFRGDEARYEFRTLWESINGAGSWAANPWVWVIDFRRIEQEKKQ